MAAREFGRYVVPCLSGIQLSFRPRPERRLADNPLSLLHSRSGSILPQSQIKSRQLPFSLQPSSSNTATKKRTHSVNNEEATDSAVASDSSDEEEEGDYLGEGGDYGRKKRRKDTAAAAAEDERDGNEGEGSDLEMTMDEDRGASQSRSPTPSDDHDMDDDTSSSRSRSTSPDAAPKSSAHSKKRVISDVSSVSSRTGTASSRTNTISRRAAGSRLVENSQRKRRKSVANEERGIVGGKAAGEAWNDPNGLKFREGVDGRGRERLVLVKKRLKKFDMPMDSTHPDKDLT
jgi:hypothetical protein